MTAGEDPPAPAASPPGSLLCTAEELRMLFLFEKLDDDRLEWLCERGRMVSVEPGPVYREGESATLFYVLVEGTVAVTSKSTGRRSGACTPGPGRRIWATGSRRSTTIRCEC